MILTNCSTPGSTYYVDAFSGNDSNPGTIEKPFQTIEKVNQLKLQAGNSVFFAGGQTFKGQPAMAKAFQEQKKAQIKCLPTEKAGQLLMRKTVRELKPIAAPGFRLKILKCLDLIV